MSDWETETCSRCGGCGEYSYCEMYGRTCFKCAGSGKTYTKRAAAARNWLRERLEVPVVDLKIGDRVFVSGVGRFTIRQLGPTGSFCTNNQTGEKTEYFNISGDKLGYHTFATSKVQRVPTSEQVAEAIAYQNSLTKQGKERRR